MLTSSQNKALNILKVTSFINPISAVGFASLMWPDSNMHTKVSNQGNGACQGKAAWLCAGSYLAKLKRKGWVTNFSGNGFYITEAGKKILNV